MNPDDFEGLLHEEESATIDFKREQYRFVRATDDEKSELLKDILGFSNAWRRSDACILIGVEDVRGGRAKVVGIPPEDHLDDHALQQFVNSLTNTPVRFRYEAFGFAGKQVGIIRIEHQRRPIYLKRDYGKLARGQVYVRRGSSTDPKRPATPEEIADMGVGVRASAAELVVEFADAGRDEALGARVSLSAEFCEMPPEESIPDFVPGGTSRPFGLDTAFLEFGLTGRRNASYYRELATYEFARRLLRPVRFVIKNVGRVAANNVRLEMTVAAGADTEVIRASKMPRPPRRYEDLLANISQRPSPAVRPRRDGAVDVVRQEERTLIVVECGHLQPGRRVWSDAVYFGKASSGEVELQCLLLADSLPQAAEFALNFVASVARTTMTLEELAALQVVPTEIP